MTFHAHSHSKRHHQPVKPAPSSTYLWIHVSVWMGRCENSATSCKGKNSGEIDPLNRDFFKLQKSLNMKDKKADKKQQSYPNWSLAFHQCGLYFSTIRYSSALFSAKSQGSLGTKSNRALTWIFSSTISEGGSGGSGLRFEGCARPLLDCNKYQNVRCRTFSKLCFEKEGKKRTKKRRERKREEKKRKKKKRKNGEPIACNFLFPNCRNQVDSTSDRSNKKTLCPRTYSSFGNFTDLN